MTQEDLKKEIYLWVSKRADGAVLNGEDVDSDIHYAEMIMDVVDQYVSDLIGEDENVGELYPRNLSLTAMEASAEALRAHARNDYRSILRKRAGLED